MSWSRIKVFFGIYIGSVASIWGVTEAYTYFTGDSLRVTLSSFWWLLFYGAPLVIATLAVVFYRRPSNRALADKKIDDAREKVREWGKRVTQIGWDEQAWHLLGHALQFAHEAIENDPGYQRSWTLLADIYCRIGEKELALECLKRSYKLATPGPYHPGRFYREVEERIRHGCPQTSPDWFREKYARYWTLPLGVVVVERRFAGQMITKATNKLLMNNSVLRRGKQRINKTRKVAARYFLYIIIYLFAVGAGAFGQSMVASFLTISSEEILIGAGIISAIGFWIIVLSFRSEGFILATLCATSLFGIASGTLIGLIPNVRPGDMAAIGLALAFFAVILFIARLQQE